MKRQKIKKLAKDYDIALIYLFGSQAEKGAKYLDGVETETNEFSDLDVAVAFLSTPSHPILIYGRLYRDFSKILEPFSLDLVFMHEMDTLFQYEIIKGVRVYENDETFADQFEEMIMKKAGDLSFKKKLFIQDVLEAIKDGYFEFGYSPHS